jgi:large subunit ribosomal protein L25
MLMLVLNIEKRDAKKNLDTLRKSGKMPAVFYGHKEKSTPIAVSRIEFKKVWKEGGESSVVVLKGDNAEHETLINAVDLNPLNGEPRHADFYVIEKGKKVTVKVPLEFVGISPAVKELGGVLVKVLHELEIEVMPKDLPHNIEVDISSIANISAHITVKDLKLPSGVTATAAPDEVVALVAEPKEEVIEEVAVDLSSIEVEKKGKVENAEEETPASA